LNFLDPFLKYLSEGWRGMDWSKENNAAKRKEECQLARYHSTHRMADHDDIACRDDQGREEVAGHFGKFLWGLIYTAVLGSRAACP
jgi:hypothetical protein